MAELIEIHNLSKSYGKKEVLKNVDLNLSGGKIIGLLGPKMCIRDRIYINRKNIVNKTTQFIRQQL